MYYVRGMTVSQVAEELGVYPSTAYRTLRRAEQRLFRCLRYGAGSYLKDMGEDT
jgi:RNA polymerase sigma-70 factor (ECF subfamily)